MTTQVQLTALVKRLSLLNPADLLASIGAAAHEISTPPPGDPDRLVAMAGSYRSAASSLRGLDASVVRAADAFDGAAGVLDDLARSIREQQSRHGALHEALRVAAHDATHAFGLPIPDPVGVARLVGVVGDLIRGCVEVYTSSIEAADRAATRFADLRGKALAAAGVRGGLAPAEAARLAEHMVGVLPDGFDDGVLSPSQLERAGHRLGSLGPGERARFAALGGTPVERAWLMKALAAGHSLVALEDFWSRIRGVSDLSSRLTLIDRGGVGEQVRLGHVVRQYEATTCGTTSLIVARAERDPVYALGLTSGDFGAAFTAERARVHDETNRVYPEAIGTSPAGMAGYLTRYCDVEYRWRVVDDTSRRGVSGAMRDVLVAVDRGYAVPLLLGGAVPRHYVLVVGHEDGVVLLFEPTQGVTVAVAAEVFLEGRLAEVAGFDHVQAAVVPVH